MENACNLGDFKRMEDRLTRSGQGAKSIGVPKDTIKGIFHKRPDSSVLQMDYMEYEVRIMAVSGPIESAPKLFGDRYASRP